MHFNKLNCVQERSLYKPAFRSVISHLKSDESVRGTKTVRDQGEFKHLQSANGN